MSQADTIYFGAEEGRKDRVRGTCVSDRESERQTHIREKLDICLIDIT